MVRGLYTAYTGMINQQARLDVVSNNLANATTAGFKKEGATSQSFDSVLAIKIRDGSEGYVDRPIGNMSLGVKVGETYSDFTQGSFKPTGATYDVAISNKGFFAVSYTNRAGEESTMYTRDGSFTLNKDGFLVTKDGDYVLGQGGLIQIPVKASSVAIDELGQIWADNVYVDRLTLVDFEDYNYLEKYGENLYIAVDGATMKEADATISQGYLEMSNVNVVSEMVEMINISRAYESNQKLITAIDETLGKAVTLGQVR